MARPSWCRALIGRPRMLADTTAPAERTPIRGPWAVCGDGKRSPAHYQVGDGKKRRAQGRRLTVRIYPAKAGTVNRVPTELRPAAGRTTAGPDRLARLVTLSSVRERQGTANVPSATAA